MASPGWMGITSRVILHISFDYFFASCEQNRNPELSDMPIIIGDDPLSKKKGFVSAMNYKAEEAGIRVGMMIQKAHERCPHATFLRPDMAYYKQVSQRVMELLEGLSDSIQTVSLDEVFLDATTQSLDIKGGAELAKTIRRALYDKEGLTACFGVATNKSIAKIASQINRPDAITVVELGREKEFISGLLIEMLPNAGEKTLSKLREFGIETIGELAKVPESDLKAEFGQWGSRLHYLANGIDDSEVKKDDGIRSMVRYETFEEDILDHEELRSIVSHLVDKAWEDMKRESVKPRTVGVKIRFADFETHTKDRTKSFAIKNPTEAKEYAWSCLESFLASNKGIRLVGVRFSNLEPASSVQKSVEDFF